MTNYKLKTITNGVLLNRAPTSTQLHPPPPSSFQPPPSSLQHPQQYLNQNIARNWAISPNLGRKTKSCPFWLKIGTHGILEVLIPNPDLDLKFWPQSPFLGKFGPKNSKVSVLSENWCTQYLKDADPKCRLRFLKFVWKLVYIVSQGCWFLFQY